MWEMNYLMSITLLLNIKSTTIHSLTWLSIRQGWDVCPRRFDLYRNPPVTINRLDQYKAGRPWDCKSCRWRAKSGLIVYGNVLIENTPIGRGAHSFLTFCSVYGGYNPNRSKFIAVNLIYTAQGWLWWRFERCYRGIKSYWFPLWIERINRQGCSYSTMPNLYN